jgi:pimeloyl-ACP methyl ester carboxylesterase
VSVDRVVDGVRLHVLSAGRPAQGRLPVLLVHGAPTTAALWVEVVRDLGLETTVAAPDLPGLGRSERPRGRTGPPEHARMLVALLDDLGLDRVVVAAHGLGGAVAVHLAVIAPRRVAGLVLCSTPVHADAWPPPAVLPLLVPGVRLALASALGRSRWLADGVVGAALGAPGPAAAAAAGAPYAAALRTTAGTRALVDALSAVDMAATEAAWALLRSAPPPTLVLWGEDDVVHASAYGRRLAGELPDAAWVPVTGAGHLLPTERPERVAEELAAFAAEVAAVRS